jgi:hypothetical protein
MNTFIEYIKNMSYWYFIAFFVVLAIILSEVLIIIQSYIFYGEIRADLILVGFITPAIDAFIIALLVGIVFVKLKDKELQLSETEQFLRLSQNYGALVHGK